MASQQATVDRVLASLAAMGDVTAKKMFGEYSLYHETKLFAIVADDMLFVKITPGSRAFLDESYDAPPYPGAKLFICVPEEKWSEEKWMVDMMRATCADLPVPPPKKPKLK